MLRYVNVIDGYVSGTYWAGGIAGRNYGVIEYYLLINHKGRESAHGFPALLAIAERSF